jgi:hypothetical protein
MDIYFLNHFGEPYHLEVVNEKESDSVLKYVLDLLGIKKHRIVSKQQYFVPDPESNEIFNEKMKKIAVLTYRKSI